MQFAPQKPVYLHHRLWGQLAQHLENGMVERAVHAGSLKGMNFEDTTFEDTGEQHSGPSNRE